MELPILVKTARKKAGLTQADLADQAEVSQASLARLENRGSVSEKIIAAVLKVLRNHGAIEGAPLPEESDRGYTLVEEPRLTRDNFPIFSIRAVVAPDVADVIVFPRPGMAGAIWGSIALTPKGRAAHEIIVRGSKTWAVWNDDPSVRFYAVRNGPSVVRLGESDARKAIRWDARNRPWLIEDSTAANMIG